jgi:RNA polymerase II subunit A small phosphatase-like protein
MSARQLLVLDLDETLIHASELALERPADFRVHHYHIYVRPHLARFVAWALSHFEVGIWTSSGRLYAESVVARIFPADSLQFLWSSERCTIARDWDTGEYRGLKCLKKLKRKGYSLQNVLAIDDSSWKHVRNYGNLITIAEYNGESEDLELPRLAAYLDTLRTAPDVRVIEKRLWQARFSEHRDVLGSISAPPLQE